MKQYTNAPNNRLHTDPANSAGPVSQTLWIEGLRPKNKEEKAN